MIKKLDKYKIHIFCFFIAFIVLLFTSKNSFLYVFNNWCDTNAFFTVGKSMVHGLVPYRDLFEQKGILLYLIYALGYLISHKTFYGVFILEVISFSIFLYYISKIVKLYFKSKYIVIIIPLLALLLTTSYSFAQGGSCEEFCFPFFGITLYYFIKYFKSGLNNKEIVLSGFIAGLVFMMKYTLLGLWIGFGLLIVIDLLIKKEFKNIFLFCIRFIIGMIIPIIVLSLFLIIIGGFKGFIYDYFYINIFVYSDKIKLIDRLYLMIIIFPYIMKKNGFIISFMLICMPVYSLFIKNDKRLKISLIILLFIFLFFISWTLKMYRYYYLPVLIFILFSIIGILYPFKKYIDSFLDKKYIKIYYVIYICLIVFLSYYNANFKEEINYTKKDYFQYKYADYINRKENPTVLNAGWLDTGIYMTSDVLPSTKYFELQNIDHSKHSENIDAMNKYIENREVEYVTYVTSKEIDKIPDIILENYNQVYKDDYSYEGGIYNVYLFEVK